MERSKIRISIRNEYKEDMIADAVVKKSNSIFLHPYHNPKMNYGTQHY